MKFKLIAMIISTTLIGGAGATLYTSKAVDTNGANNGKHYETVQVQDSKDGQKIVENLNCNKEKASNESVTAEENNSNVSKINSTIKNNNVQKNSGQDVKQNSTKQKKDNTVESKKESSAKEVSNKKDSKTENTKAESKVQNTSDKFMEQVENRIFQKVNQERAKAGVPALSYNNTMVKYARMKSQDMGDRRYFDHKDPQGNLMSSKMKNDGLNYKAWGENIAYIGGSYEANALADEFMTNWMNSPGHRQNILSTNFSSIGVGVYKIGDKVYATQEFYR